MNDDNIIIRNGRESDIDQILEIEHKSFETTICEEKSVFYERLSIFKEGFLVIEYNEKVVGYLCSEIWEYKDKISEEHFILGHSISKTHSRKGDEIYVSSFAILPEVRKYGLGKMLFKYFLDNVNKLVENPKSIILIVAENWNVASKLYEKEGFVKIASIKDFFYYGAVPPLQADAVIMRKLL